MKTNLLFSFMMLLLPFQVIGQASSVVPPVKIEYKSRSSNNSGSSQQESMQEIAKRVEKELRTEANYKITSTRNLYNSIGNYPESVTDGWHLVKVVSEHPIYPSHQEAKVLVSENKIKEIYYNGFSRFELALSSQIKDGKSYIKTATNEGGTSELREVFFIDYIVDPSFTSKAPEIGYISFWADFLYDGDIYIQINGTQSGYLNAFYPKGSYPTSCDEKEVLKLPYKTGTYSFTARTLRPVRVWEGTVTIKDGECGLFRLSK